MFKKQRKGNTRGKRHGVFSCVSIILKGTSTNYVTRWRHVLCGHFVARVLESFPHSRVFVTSLGHIVCERSPTRPMGALSRWYSGVYISKEPQQGGAKGNRFGVFSHVSNTVKTCWGCIQRPGKESPMTTYFRVHVFTIP